ncbi:MAG: Uma2 family endonuclease [Leptolyngbyaceae bacterium]|nr:Uma2 family endonuclease [Leptolyngbyaceae bacterium]
MVFSTEFTAKPSLTDYLDCSAENQLGSDEGRREFVDGEIIEMPPESPQNTLISLFLLIWFSRLVPLWWLRRMDTELVIGSRVRMPDFLVLGEELALALDESGRSTITVDMPPPLLVVEVVSPGKANRDRDYRFKRSEYGARSIPEYWIVDPEQEKISVLTLVDGWYEVEEFTEDEVIQSPQFANLNLIAHQVLNPKEGNS